MMRSLWNGAKTDSSPEQSPALQIPHSRRGQHASSPNACQGQQHKLGGAILGHQSRTYALGVPNTPHMRPMLLLERFIGGKTSPSSRRRY
jgi:hypothetical protein